ncbi:MAG: hypothetical protein KDE48_06310 [Anaerolineales bacterium]|nr:hypothetical protein [Anaerolineales bacterium]
MKKVAFLLIALLLVACNATTDPNAAPTDVTVSENTAEQSGTTEAQPEETGETAVSSDSTGNEFNIATTPEEAGRVRDRDWVKGATDPKVTIIEYGDFQ